MSQSSVVILGSGGLRSLVAAAVVLSHAEKVKLIAVHIKDGRENADVRLEHARRQADHFKISQRIELELPHLQPEAGLQGKPGPAGSQLVRPQILLAGMAQALELKAGRLVWPAQFDGDYAAIARSTEQTVLTQHLAQLEHPQVPAVETPMLELTDVQMLELGAQLDVPWQLAWSCLSGGPRPCQACVACRRRRTSFEHAGMVDPVEKTLKPARV
ncbi:MAG: 7-cyano-7-deazaguanine synthase [Planctomycetota bacterium]|nr:7-cyano-7-deazaguanine synthase [Planctomycetota bacterium]